MTRRTNTRMLVDEYRRLAKKFDALRESDGHGGSPGEGLVERMGQIETELKQRGAEELLAPPPYGCRDRGPR